MGRAAKFKKGQLIRRKSKVKSTSTNNPPHQQSQSQSKSTSTNNLTPQQSQSQSILMKEPSHQQIINWLLDPELHHWIYQLWDKKITFDFIAKMLESLTNQILNDPNYKDDHMCQAPNKNYTIGVNTFSWTLWISLINYNMNQLILDAPDWSKTPFDF